MQHTFEIYRHIGAIAKPDNGWTKELNKVSFNGGEPKFDIRTWDPEHTKMGKGVTLTEAELDALKEALNK